MVVLLTSLPSLRNMRRVSIQVPTLSDAEDDFDVAAQQAVAKKFKVVHDAKAKLELLLGEIAELEELADAVLL